MSSENPRDLDPSMDNLKNKKSVPSLLTPSTNNMMTTKQKHSSLSERLNIGNEVRELKLGSTFNTNNSSTPYHTIKYDFRPASLDTNSFATVDVASNNQVTVTMPNTTNSSGVSHTVFKGNHRNYTKECLIIVDKKTGEITLEKLNQNIQVKITRSEKKNKQSMNMMPQAMAGEGNSGGSGGIIGLMPNTNLETIPGDGSNGGRAGGEGGGTKLKNTTTSISSNKKTSIRKGKNQITKSSSSRPAAPLHSSPQSPPAWIANNAKQSLPSNPMILDNVAKLKQHHHATNDGLPIINDYPMGNSSKKSKQSTRYKSQNQRQCRKGDNTQQQHQPQQEHQAPLQQQQTQHKLQRQKQNQHQRQSPPNLTSLSIGGSYGIVGQQRYSGSHPQQNHHQHSKPSGLESPHDIASQSFANAAGDLNASSSSSESDSRDSSSYSDCDDNSDHERPIQHQHQSQQDQPNLGKGSSISRPPISQQLNDNQNHQSNGAFPSDLDILQSDLQLSSDEDDN